LKPDYIDPKDGGIMGVSFGYCQLCRQEEIARYCTLVDDLQLHKKVCVEVGCLHPAYYEIHERVELPMPGKGESSTPTPWAVRCIWCEPGGGLVFLTYEEYVAQLAAAGSRWVCPRCGDVARWDDANYEARSTNDLDDSWTNLQGE
jgi:hypothetical protein